MTDTTDTKPTLSQLLSQLASELGKRGGKAQKNAVSKEQLSAWGKKGVGVREAKRIREPKKKKD